METELYLKPDSVIMTDLGIEENGPVHAYFTAECVRYMDQFVPFRTGALAETVLKDGVIVEENVTTDTIIYNQEYAEYVYYGLSKNEEPLNYTKDMHENAGPFWDEVMWDIYGEEITENVQKYLEEFGGANNEL